MTSPYAPYAGYVDVRAFPAGTIVNCPYSGKSFQVPSYSSGNHNSYSQQAHESLSTQLQQSTQKTQSKATQSRSSSEEWERIRNIQDPNERVRANTAMIKSMLNGINQNAENARGITGMSSDEFMLESMYKTAREKGLPPSEARIEAQRDFRNMKKFLNQ